MDANEYFRSLTAEINALKDRIRNFIGEKHWLSDGLWKESVIKAILRRYLPGAAGVGTGFVVTDMGPTTQIDILIYDLTKPVLFRDDIHHSVRRNSQAKCTYIVLERRRSKALAPAINQHLAPARLETNTHPRPAPDD